MSRYVFSPGPQVKDERITTTQKWVEQELQAIERATGETLELDLRTSFHVPVRPRPGMIVYADGTYWNPGAGEGAYAYSEGGLWVPLGGGGGVGSAGLTPVAVTGSATLTPAALSSLVHVDATAAPAVILFPDAATVPVGGRIGVKKVNENTNFVFTNSFDDAQLMNRPIRPYSLDPAPALAVKDRGDGKTRIKFSVNVRGWVDGDRIRIEGGSGFPALNADHVIEEVRVDTGEHQQHIDLPNLAYAPGYSGGATVHYIQTSHAIRQHLGWIIYYSNGVHWEVDDSTDDIYFGKVDKLFNTRSRSWVGYVESMAGYPHIEAWYNSTSDRVAYRSARFSEDEDPVDIFIVRKGYSGGKKNTDFPAALGAGNGVGLIAWQGSEASGNTSGSMGGINMITEETQAPGAHGGSMFFLTTGIGQAAGTRRVWLNHDGDVRLGGNRTSGSFVASFADPSTSWLRSGVAAGEARLLADGSVADVLMRLVTKGARGFLFQTGGDGLGGGSPVTAFEIAPVAGANRHVVVSPSNGGNPTLGASAGNVAFSGPFAPAAYTVGTLPIVVPGTIIFVTDESGGPTPAFGRGANWLRFVDNAVVA